MKSTVNDLDNKWRRVRRGLLFEFSHLKAVLTYILLSKYH